MPEVSPGVPDTTPTDWWDHLPELTRTQAWRIMEDAARSGERTRDEAWRDIVGYLIERGRLATAEQVTDVRGVGRWNTEQMQTRMQARLDEVEARLAGSELADLTERIGRLLPLLRTHRLTVRVDEVRAAIGYSCRFGTEALLPLDEEEVRHS